MNGRNLAVFAALTTILAGFAGCIEAPDFLNTDVEATALTHKDQVDAAAAAWNPQALLVGIAGPELAEAEHDLPADPQVGNGQAPLWFYGYAVFADNQSDYRLFEVAADGTIRERNETRAFTMPEDMEDATPVNGVKIDSDKAMEAAKANATFAEFLGTGNVSLMNALGQEEGITAWALVAHGDQGVLIAIVDAIEGNLLQVMPFNMDFDFKMPNMGAMPGIPFDPADEVHLEGEGTLDASEPDFATESFTIAEGTQQAVLALKMEGRLPTDSLVWALVDDDGEVVESNGLYTFSGRADETWDFELEPGEYTLELSYRAMTPVDLGGVDYAFKLDVTAFEIDVDM